MMCVCVCRNAGSVGLGTRTCHVGVRTSGPKQAKNKQRIPTSSQLRPFRSLFTCK
jgi:hypothetical protein